MSSAAPRWQAGALLALALSTACPAQAPSTDAALDASMHDGSSATPDAASLDGGPPDASLLDATGEGGGSFTLDDGTRITVDDEGRLALARADGSALTAIAAPRLRTFAQSARMLLGMYTVTRRDQATHPLFFRRASTSSEGVSVEYVDPRGGSLTLLVRVGAARERTTIEVSGADLARDAVVLPFGCDGEASFLGFGEQYDALDHRGESFELFSSEQGIGRVPERPRSPTNGDRHTTYFPMPYWLDLRGFGVLVDADARMQADLCATETEHALLEVEGGAELAIEVFHGPSPLGVIEQLGAHVGRPRRPPAWAFSPWIGIQGGRDAVLAEHARLRAEGVPFSALWSQDWSGRREFTPGRFGVDYRWVADETLYPDLAGMIDVLHADGVRFLAYANPFVVTTNLHYAPMAADGLLIEDAEGAPYAFTSVFTMASIPDFTREQTYAYVEGYLRTMTRATTAGGLGIDGWMADFGEWIPPDATFADGRDGMQAHAGYPRSWHLASRRSFDAERPDGDWVMFTRSGWTRSHDTVQIVWVGDQEADWSEHDGLPTVLPALLSLGLSGIPFVTHDIAGFSGGPSTRELFQRWTELGAFTPVFRTHEGLMRAANWRWSSDAETIAHFRRFARLHEALAPEWAALADEAATRSHPILRPLALAFPGDPGSRGVIDELLIGTELLVAPVLVEGATSRGVYLPPGTWFHVWTGDRFDGPRTVEVAAPIGSPPFFSRGIDRPDLRAL